MSKPESADENGLRPQVKKVGPPETVPVFNCVAYVSQPGEAGKVSCRCANLAGLELVAQSEREALQQMVSRFKDVVASCQATGRDVPWIDPPEEPSESESVRYLAVHS